MAADVAATFGGPFGSSWLEYLKTIEESVGSEATGTRLCGDCADLAALRRELPGLILSHNLLSGPGRVGFANLEEFYAILLTDIYVPLESR